MRGTARSSAISPTPSPRPHRRRETPILGHVELARGDRVVGISLPALPHEHGPGRQLDWGEGGREAFERGGGQFGEQRDRAQQRDLHDRHRRLGVQAEQGAAAAGGGQGQHGRDAEQGEPAATKVHEHRHHHGRSILLSSHILAEAEALSDRVTIIRDGKAVETGTLAEMRHLTRDFVDAEVARPADLGGLPGVHELTVTGTVVRCQVDQAALDAVLGRLHQAGVRSLTCRPPTLEELFLRHYSSERTTAGVPQ